MTGANPLHPDHLSAAERISEIAAILARGLVRLTARPSSQRSADRAESSLDYGARRSGHADPAHGGEAG
jgi:hypothetical protein